MTEVTLIVTTVFAFFTLVILNSIDGSLSDIAYTLRHWHDSEDEDVEVDDYNDDV